MNSRQQRLALQSQLFPAGIPSLWCPVLTHFREAHEPDAKRIQAHIASLAPYVSGILVPGSTGEGWEMTDSDIRKVLSIVLPFAASREMKVLIGVLKTSVEDMLRCIDSMKEFAEHPSFVGWTICPPKGSGMSQPEIEDGLSAILALGWPTALYQLPQVTQNEMAANTVSLLAEKFPNFIMFKDTSGEDRVATSGLDFGGVFMVRGSEQAGYWRWPRAANGCYDGFLLSTANVLAKEHSRMLEMLDGGHIEEAKVSSSKLEGIVTEVFAMFKSFPYGNVFSNANKALDHCMAYGDDATQIPPPLLYSGQRLPVAHVEKTVELLRANDLLPTKGYLSRID